MFSTKEDQKGAAHETFSLLLPERGAFFVTLSPQPMHSVFSATSSRLHAAPRQRQQAASALAAVSLTCSPHRLRRLPWQGFCSCSANNLAGQHCYMIAASCCGRLGQVHQPEMLINSRSNTFPMFDRRQPRLHASRQRPTSYTLNGWVHESRVYCGSLRLAGDFVHSVW